MEITREELLSFINQSPITKYQFGREIECNVDVLVKKGFVPESKLDIVLEKMKLYGYNAPSQDYNNAYIRMSDLKRFLQERRHLPLLTLSVMAKRGNTYVRNILLRDNDLTIEQSKTLLPVMCKIGYIITDDNYERAKKYKYFTDNEVNYGKKLEPYFELCKRYGISLELISRACGYTRQIITRKKNKYRNGVFNVTDYDRIVEFLESDSLKFSNIKFTEWLGIEYKKHNQFRDSMPENFKSKSIEFQKIITEQFKALRNA